MENIKEISIQWESSGYSVLKALPASILGIFCEFIDNSIQSSKQQRDNILKIEPNYKLRIDIDYNGNEIIIQDNAGGIDEYNFVRALKPANKADDIKGLNEFGLGMKYAAVWISNEWELISSAIGEDVERSVIFNYHDVIKNNIEKLPCKNRNVGKDSHYTKVILRNLEQKHVNRFPQSFLEKKLPFIYRNFIREQSSFFDDYREDNIEIFLFNNQKPLKWEEYGFLKKWWYKDYQEDLNRESILHEWKYKIPLTPIDYEEEVQDQKGNIIKVKKPIKISGFIGILPDGQQKGKNGFVLFRRGRVVEGSETRIFPKRISGPSPRAAKSIRLFGELHFSNVDVSFDKSKLSISQKRKDEIFGVLATMIKNVVFETDPKKRKLNFINQAEKYRPTFNIEDAINAAKKLISETPKIRDEISIAKELKISSIEFDDKYIADEEQNKNEGSLQNQTLTQQHHIDGKLWDVIVQFTDKKKLGEKLYTINNDSDKTLRVTVNHDHLIFQNQDNLKHSYKLIINFIKCFAISEIRAVQQGNEARNVRYAFNTYAPIIINE